MCRLVRCWLAGVLVLLACQGVARAQTPAPGAIAGKDEPRFGRMILSFAEPVTARVRVLGGVMVVVFDRPVTIPLDKLPGQMPAYVSAARMDPDGRSLRVALNQPVAADLKDAAEQIYIDLLPVNWRGPPPPLPSAVVAELARRARDVRETLKEMEARKATATPWPLKLHVVESEARLRLVLALPPGGAARLERGEAGAEIIISGPVSVAPDAVRSALAGRLGGLAVRSEKAGGRIGFETPAGFSVEAIEEDGVYLVDLIRPQQALPEKTPDLPLTPQKAEQGPAIPGPAVAAPPAAGAVVPPAVRAPLAVTARVSMSEGALRLALTPRVPAAVFERGGAVWVVVTGANSLSVASDGLPAANLRQEQLDGAELLRITPPRPGALVVSEQPDGWAIEIGAAVSAASVQPLRFQREVDGEGRGLMSVAMAQPEVVILTDEDSGERLFVVPSLTPAQAVIRRQRLVGFELAATALGAVIVPEAEDVTVEALADRVTITRAGGLVLSPVVQKPTVAAEPEPLLAAGQWNDDRRGAIRGAERELTLAAATAPRYAKTAARLRLAEFYLANGFANEAAGVLSVLARDDIGAAQSRQVLLLTALAAILRDDREAAGRILDHKDIAGEPEGQLWRAYLDARTGKTAAALTSFRARARLMDRLPDVLQAVLRPAAIEAALAGGDSYLAGQHLGDLERLDETLRDPMLVTLHAGRIAEADGRMKEADGAYQQAAGAKSRAIEAEARLNRVLLGLTTGSIERKAAKTELETIAVIWRRGEVELKARVRLAEMYTEDMEWREAFLQSRRASEILPDHPLTRALHDSAARTFAALFLDGRDTKLSKVQALAILDEFRGLIPPGERGDNIVSRLAERLYALDLIDQAAELLDYQVKNRLKGLARIKAATRLAVMQLANGKPQEALKALRASRMAHMPEELRRARALIEARALADAGRGELAIDLIANEQGNDAERLRADIHWAAKRWAEAAEAYERALGGRWQEETALDEGERADLIRAGVAYGLGGDRLGLDRLRSRYLARLEEGGDAETFRLITMDSLSRPDAFRAVARGVARTETFDAFLQAYRKRYPDMAGKPKPRPGEAGG